MAANVEWMRRAVPLLVTIVWSCGAPSAPAPRSVARTTVAPAAGDAGATTTPAGSDLDPPPLASSDGGGSVVAEAKPAEPAETAETAETAKTAETAETATPAKFGQSLEPGLYVFPDGLRIRVEQTAGCDFDTSVPCFYGTYRAHAKFGKKEATVEWSTLSTTVLGYRIQLANSRFIVRK